MLAAFILRTIYDDKLKGAEQDIRSLVRFNGESLQAFIENTRLSVIAAAELELIDPSCPDARDRGEKVYFP